MKSTDGYINTIICEVKSEIESSSVGYTTMKAKILAACADEVGQSSEELLKKLAMQMIITDYLVNERVSGNMLPHELKSLCRDLGEEGGLDKLYAIVLYFLGGSSREIRKFQGVQA